MLDDIQEKISQGILDSVNKVKEEKDAHYMANPAQLPDRGSIDLLIERCSNQNALISGGTSLIPGPWGMAAAIPEIVMVSKKQIEMIYDIARAHGHKHIDSNLLLSVMLSASGQGTAALVVVHGQKIVMKRAGARVVQQMVELLGGKITQQVAKSMAAKWIPIAGAVAMAAWSRYSTQKIGEKAKETFYNARKAGFDNISIDLMFAVPNQGIVELKKDLETIKELNPEHISIYSLIWEEGTPFWDMLQQGTMKACDNDIEADMFELIIDTLTDMGYTHYEISNFAKTGKEARHNSKYWENKEYIALGIGASFYTEGFRGKNLLGFNEYYEAIDKGEKPWFESEKVDNPKEYEYMLGLRLLQEGIVPTEENIKITCEKLKNDGYLEIKSGKYLLTRKGIFFANYVFEQVL